MEKAGNTSSLRSMAPHWSLAGDKQLLNVLQNIHQKIMTHCQETNSKLDEMASALDSATIDLQNVNNRFMALSNSQFIESRVYDDELVTAVEETPTKPKSVTAIKKTDPEAELEKMKEGIKTLESMHECVRILESDSESDSGDDEGRMILKPLDLYAHRPLPYIIGSQGWKTKWHAGLIAEDSDSDSSTTKPGEDLLEQYSESESELTDTQTDRLHPPQRTISSSSSMVDSEPSAPPAPVSQAHIAAELARKLGGNILEIPIRTPEPELTKPSTAPTKVYKPQNPATSTIFFDEPPPLDETYQSDKDSFNDDDDDDIFAELHKKKPSFGPNKNPSRLNEELFDFKNSHSVPDDIFGIEKSDLHETNGNEHANVDKTEENEKKPIGGISLFGSSKGAKSIGEAILKRNERRTYSSDEESEKETFEKNAVTKAKISNTDTKDNSLKSIPNRMNSSKENSISQMDKSVIKKNVHANPEKDILQQLFTKNKTSNNRNENKKLESTSRNNVIDLFNDNIFDDLEDIFTDDTKKKTTKDSGKSAKSIFDDDDDELFADIAITNANKTSSKDTKTKGLFDSDNDDDLFSVVAKISSDNNINASNSKSDDKCSPETIGIFNSINKLNIYDDNSDEDTLFNPETNKIKSKGYINFIEKKDIEEQSQNTIVNEEIESSKDDDDNNNQLEREGIVTNKVDAESASNREINELAFRENDEENCDKITDTFSKVSHESKNKTMTNELNFTKHTIEQSPALFDDEDIDDLFTNLPKKEDEVKDIGEDLHNEKIKVTNETMNTETLDKESAIVNAKDLNRSNTKVSTESSVKEILPPGSLEIIDDVVLPISIDAEKTEQNRKKEPQRIGDKIKSDTFADYLINSPLPTVPNEQSTRESDIFDDIFDDEPPEFEKPKEPKKSKNVNALFDDDSDDEALFFKKDGVISDEKPDLSPTAKEDNLFRIFSDEPPAIDVDFMQKPPKSQIIKPVRHKDLNEPTSKIDDEDRGSISREEQIFNVEVVNNSVEEPTSKIDEHAETISSFREQTSNVEVVDNFASSENKKPIGKLKAINLNINVNTLLPGFSPKKSKVADVTDGQIISVQEKAKPNIEDNESKLVKTDSLEGEVDSELLDNKFSKERAKIQVKRRPSTRRARREAVKKSGIIFDSTDSTDNSNSIDDQNSGAAFRTEEVKEEKNIKSKVVYILNDEDIFTNVDTNNTMKIDPKVQTVNDTNILQNDDGVPEFDEDNDIFKKIKVAKVENNQSNDLTIVPDKDSQQYKTVKDDNVSIKADTSLKHKKASVFDDMSDEEAELFQSKKTVTTNTKSIFGSDSDEELFANSNKKSAKKKDTPSARDYKAETRKSLFDDDSDNDLFGRTSNSSENKNLYSKPKQVKTVLTQEVVEDPLSLLTDDD
ncbi:WASH complex subunit 2 [Battus philenor]|uniref:WASH complex subunit 2 n=1 Tax=Battus philenor TaxID=42288 RepID=UPI0035D01D22